MAGVLLDPVLWVVVIGASVLGAVGNLALYYLGRRGTGPVFARFPNLEGERWERIGGYYHRYGGKLLLFSAVPGLGTVLTTGAGAFGIKRISFLFWVILAKMMRNWVLLLVFQQSFKLLRG